MEVSVWRVNLRGEPLRDGEHGWGIRSSKSEGPTGTEGSHGTCDRIRTRDLSEERTDFTEEKFTV